MAIEVEVEGIGTLEFPDNTDQSVIQKTVRRLVGERSESLAEETAPGAGTEFFKPTEAGAAIAPVVAPTVGG
ncbi:hypothetical protein LCGC14_1612680, partial [marine sediment metagenome]